VLPNSDLIRPIHHRRNKHVLFHLVKRLSASDFKIKIGANIARFALVTNRIVPIHYSSIVEECMDAIQFRNSSAGPAAC
jgi:hypothetical protein